MNQEKSFKLVDGVFAASEAEQVINALIGSKINYHSMQDFSNSERFGTDQAHSQKRIAALKDVQRSIKELLNAAAEEGFKVKMDGFIEITIIK